MNDELNIVAHVSWGAYYMNTRSVNLGSYNMRYSYNMPYRDLSQDLKNIFASYRNKPCIRVFVEFGHDFFPVRIQSVEFCRLFRQLLSDILAKENIFKIHPLPLHLENHFDSFHNERESTFPLVDSFQRL